MTKADKTTVFIYLDMMRREGKDWTDPTYLMQAFSLKRARAIAIIAEYRQAGRIDQ